MSFDPINGHTDVPPHSDWEEGNIPNRAQTITATAVPHPNSQTQQGVVATQNDKPVIAGVDPAQISFYRWW